MTDLGAIVKAYDIRGLVPQQWGEAEAAALGAAFADRVGGPIAVARDMRASGERLAAAFAEAAVAAGAEVTDAGLCSTDELYFISGKYDMAGAMFTASHNPAGYNGLKLCGPAAKPIGLETGLAELRDAAQRLLDGAPAPRAAAPGALIRRDFLSEYAEHLRTLVDLRRIRPLRAVVDAANGMAGHTVPAVLGEGLPLETIPLYFELDGTFPNHEANPLKPENLRDLQRAVLEHGADLGLAFDGDADRCFVVDEKGQPVSPSAITAMVAAAVLAENPGGTVIHNLITSRAVPEIVSEAGGRPVRTRVGHSYIKAEMARTGAVFGGEHSAHYYFRDFWSADTGMLAAMHVLAALGGGDEPLSQLASGYERYASSGEVNTETADPAGTLEKLAAAFAGRDDVEIDRMDGVTVSFQDSSWFNARPSNTEPLLRLNVEASDASGVERLRDQVLDLIGR